MLKRAEQQGVNRKHYDNTIKIIKDIQLELQTFYKINDYRFDDIYIFDKCSAMIHSGYQLVEIDDMSRDEMINRDNNWRKFCTSSEYVVYMQDDIISYQYVYDNFNTTVEKIEELRGQLEELEELKKYYDNLM